MTTIRDGLKDALGAALDPKANRELARKIKKIGYHLVPGNTTIKMLEKIDFSPPKYVAYSFLEDVGKKIETVTPFINSALLIGKETLIDYLYIRGLQGDVKAGIFGLALNAASGTLYENFLDE